MIRYGLRNGGPGWPQIPCSGLVRQGGVRHRGIAGEIAGRIVGRIAGAIAALVVCLAPGSAIGQTGPGTGPASEIIVSIDVMPIPPTGAGETGTRIRITHTGALDWQMHAHASPPRLHLDFSNSIIANGSFAVAANPFVAGLRHGRLTVSDVRVILQLIAPVRLQHVQTVGTGENGVAHLMIDLARSDAAGFARMAATRPVLRQVSRSHPLPVYAPQSSDLAERRPAPAPAPAPGSVRERTPAIVVIQDPDGRARAVVPARTPVSLAALPGDPTLGQRKPPKTDPVPAPVRIVRKPPSQAPPKASRPRSTRPPSPATIAVRAPPVQIAGLPGASASTEPPSDPPATPRATPEQEYRSGWRQLARSLPLSAHGDRPMVIIDAGHGGVDPGAVARSGLKEKVVTLAVARKLAEKLRNTGNFEVFLTRETDRFIKLRDRIALARTFLQDRSGTWALFVSLHADSIKSGNHHGVSVYTLSEQASDKEAAMLAHAENQVDLIAGVHVPEEADSATREILVELAQSATQEQSVLLARRVARTFREARHSLLRNPVRSAGFAVLKSPDIPSILLEMGFLSSRKDAARLRDPKWQDRLAEVLAEAITRHFLERGLPVADRQAR